MNKKNKLILSAVGLSALIIPALLLLLFSAKANQTAPKIESNARSVDARNVQEAFKNIPQRRVVNPTPAATASATVKSNEKEATSAPNSQ